MLKDSSYKKLMIGVCSFIVIGIIAIAYAAFTGQLSINGTGVNRKSNFDIYFDNVSNFLTTGTASVTDSTPINQSHTTVIEDYEATLVSPTDSVYFTFDIVNDGDYDATLTNLTIGPVKCSVNGNESDTSAQNVCSNIEYTMKYTSDNSNVSVNDTLASKETKEVLVTLTYKDFSDSSKLPTNNVSISNLGIDMVYETDSEAKTNNDGSTPKYRIGTEVTIQNKKYNIVGLDDDYVTLLKQEPLTIDEVNLYGGVGTENNHVNKNSYDTVGTAANFTKATSSNGGIEKGDTNGYGAVVYYSSPTCGYPSGANVNLGNNCPSNQASAFVRTGCSVNYDTSDIKYIVDNWATATFTNNELIEIDGYKARLLNEQDIINVGYDESNNRLLDRINWIRSNRIYWTMVPQNNKYIWEIWPNRKIIIKGGSISVGCKYGGSISNYGEVFADFGLVRPVINIKVSELY